MFSVTFKLVAKFFVESFLEARVLKSYTVVEHFYVIKGSNFTGRCFQHISVRPRFICL